MWGVLNLLDLLQKPNKYFCYEERSGLAGFFPSSDDADRADETKSNIGICYETINDAKPCLEIVCIQLEITRCWFNFGNITKHSEFADHL